MQIKPALRKITELGFILPLIATLTLAGCGGSGGSIGGSALGSNASLSNLTISAGVLVSSFNPATVTYAVDVNSATSSVTVTPTVADTNATVKVNNVTVSSGTASAAIPLAVGMNLISVVVTAQDGITAKAYVIFVTQPISCTAELVCSAASGVGGDEICVSGRVVEGTDHSQDIASSVTGNIEVRFHDLLNFLGNPTSPPFRTLTTASGSLDTCGRFTTRFSVAGDAPNGVIGITATDLAGAVTPNYVLGTAPRRVDAATNLTNARTFLVSKAQDQAWATAAGLVGSNTFASTGTLAVRYHEGGTATDAIPGTPVRGIIPTWNNMTDTTKDFFFSDSALTTLQTISATQSETGINGISFLRLGAGIGSAGGTACIKSDGGAGTLMVTGPSLTGTTAGAIVFFNLGVSCL